jgi:hypothetical protein
MLTTETKVAPAANSSNSSSSNKGASSSVPAIRLDQVIQAPIVASPHYTQSPHDLERLDTLRLVIQDLTNRITALKNNLQHLLEAYHTCMTAMSEKCILAEEKVNWK